MKILWIPHTAWRIPQRARLFCVGLAERHEVHVTDWVADFVKPSDYLSRRYAQNFMYRFYKDNGISVHGIPRISPAIFSRTIRQFNERVFLNSVQRIIDSHRIDVVVGTFVCPPPTASRVIFDLFDDNVAYWKQNAALQGYAEEIAANEQRYMALADVTVAASLVLRDKAQQFAGSERVRLIPNGIDISRYERADGHRFRASLGVTGKLVGIVGNHDKRNELAKVLQIAALMQGTETTFLIAGRGSQLAWAKQAAARMGLRNVIFHGFVPPELLPDVMNALDVGLCPYDKTEGADASSPMRLFSYLASTVPVVCTDLVSVRQLCLPNVVLVRDTVEDHVEGIRRALALPHFRPAELYEFDLPRLVTEYERVLSV